MLEHGKDFKNDPNWLIHNKENISMSPFRFFFLNIQM